MPLTERQKIGNLGESIACKHLKKRGYQVVDRNYRKKWGEIDIIAQRGDVLHFIEVKSTQARNNLRPEENVHTWKLQRLRRATQIYLLDRNVSSETDWQFDVIVVFIDIKNRKASIRSLENVIL